MQKLPFFFFSVTRLQMKFLPLLPHPATLQPPNQPGHNSVSVIINTMFSSSYSYFEKKLAKVLIHLHQTALATFSFSCHQCQQLTVLTLGLPASGTPAVMQWERRAAVLLSPRLSYKHCWRTAPINSHKGEKQLCAAAALW